MNSLRKKVFQEPIGDGSGNGLSRCILLNVPSILLLVIVPRKLRKGQTLSRPNPARGV